MTRQEAEAKAEETSKLNGGRSFKVMRVTYCASGEEGWDVTPADRRVGEQLYVACGHGMYPNSYVVGTVTKVTPSGMCDVQIGACAEPRRFNAAGRCMAKFSERDYLDDIPFETRKAMLAEEQRAEVAAALVGAIAAERNVNARWGKEGLQKEVERLQQLLDEARRSVEAI